MEPFGIIRHQFNKESDVKKAIIVLLILLALLVAALMVLTPEKKVRSDHPDVIVTTFALYDIARHLLAQDAEVQMLIPFGRDVHTYEPTPLDMARVEHARLFLYSGAGLEPWASHFASLKQAVDMSRVVSLRVAEHGHHHEAEHHDADDHEEVHASGYDPHYWLDIDNMIRLTEAMQREFIRLYPNRADAIRERAQRYIARLKQLDALYKKRLSACRLDTIVVNHNAFGYLAQRYGFHVAPITGLSPDTMPDAKTMASLSEIIRSKKINTVFYESFISDKLATALAKESGAKVAVLQPLANITAKEIGADYFRLMNENLLKLHDALECQ